VAGAVLLHQLWLRRLLVFTIDMGLAQEPMKKTYLKMRKNVTRRSLVCVAALAGAAAGSFTLVGPGSAATAPNPQVEPQTFATYPGVCPPGKDVKTDTCRNFPPGRAVSPDDVAMTESEAIKVARLGSAFGTPVGDRAATTTAVKAVKMTYGEMLKASGSGADPAISTQRPVWVVTIHAPIQGKSSPDGEPGKVFDVYSIVFDAPTSSSFLRAIGADIVGAYESQK
jgi:hypothetical protein